MTIAPDSSGVRVFFAGGGTGGHLYPGLAIARALVRLAPHVEPFFIGAARGIERDVLPSTGFPHALLDLHPLYRRAPWRNVLTIRGMVSAWRHIGKIAREKMPALVVGTGGYAAGAALAWGRAHGIPLAVHEPDSHPGVTTRAFARVARGVFLGFPEASQLLRTHRDAQVLVLGAPIEPPPAFEARRTRAVLRQKWELPQDAFVVLVTGGSQGAKALNDAVATWCERGLPDGVALIWATGQAQAAAYLSWESGMVRVRPYLSPIADAYAAADLAVTRAGAMTIAELWAWGIAAILVPLPTSAQDHQVHNARAVAHAGAAIHLPQSGLSADAIEAQVRELRNRPDVLHSMREAALRHARPNAAEDIARALLQMISPS